jgi:hypothetical protein
LPAICARVGARPAGQSATIDNASAVTAADVDERRTGSAQALLGTLTRISAMIERAVVV